MVHLCSYPDHYTIKQIYISLYLLVYMHMHDDACLLYEWGFACTTAHMEAKGKPSEVS